MTLAGVATGSTASKTIVEGECPGMGASWISMTPVSWKAAVLGKAADVKAAHAKFVPGAAGNYKNQQWCYQAVKSAGAKTKCTFASASAAKYEAALYCETIEGWFFASTKAVNVTAKDNGGKTVGMTLTYKKAISDITDNAVVLNVCGKLAETMAVPYERVTDAYGGYFKNPSPSLPTAAPAAPAAKTNTTTNATKRVLNATANKTTNTTAAAPKQTEWKLNLFVQPDPFADKVDNAATVTTLKGTAAAKAVEGVTKAKFGAATVAAATVTEAAVKFKTAPTATGGSKTASITGATDVAGYVYCAVAKTATARRFRMLNTTANATNKTTTATPAAAAPKEAVNLQSAATAAKYNIKRVETTAKALTFTMKWDTGLEDGKTYDWMCEATSLNPTNPAFRTALVKGTVKTAAAAPTGDSALWSSLFAAILMIAAVFFY